MRAQRRCNGKRRASFWTRCGQRVYRCGALPPSCCSICIDSVVIHTLQTPRSCQAGATDERKPLYTCAYECVFVDPLGTLFVRQVPDFPRTTRLPIDSSSTYRRIFHQQACQRDLTCPLFIYVEASQVLVCCSSLQLCPTSRQLFLQPNGYAFNAAINACGKAHMWEEALALLQQMEREGVEVTTVTLNAAMDA